MKENAFKYEQEIGLLTCLFYHKFVCKSHLRVVKQNIETSDKENKVKAAASLNPLEGQQKQSSAKKNLVKASKRVSKCAN